jgi:DNA-binding transcriptional LysR family regulator
MRHQCIRARMGTGKLYRWEFEKRGQAMRFDAPGSLTLDHSGLMLEAALAGAGLAYIGESSAAEHIAAGRLEIVLVDWETCRQSSFAAMAVPRCWSTESSPIRSSGAD